MCFDSILVRLKVAHCADKDDVDLKGFDSILVRLKVPDSPQYSLLGINVSIPYWFD